MLPLLEAGAFPQVPLVTHLPSTGAQAAGGGMGDKEATCPRDRGEDSEELELLTMEKAVEKDR